MSISGIKLLAQTVVVLNVQDVPVYSTIYRTTASVNGHVNGEVETEVGTLTESTFNLQVQQALADKINLETSNVEEFVASDVIGGRI